MASDIRPWFIPAILALVGAFAGTYLQAALTRSQAVDDRLFQTRLEAYRGWVEGQGLYAARSDDPVTVREVDVKIRQAALQIATFSSAAVVSAVSRFRRTPDTRPCSQGVIDEDVPMYRAIRAEMVGQSEMHVTDNELAMVLYGCSIEGS